MCCHQQQSKEPVRERETHPCRGVITESKYVIRCVETDEDVLLYRGVFLQSEMLVSLSGAFGQVYHVANIRLERGTGEHWAVSGSNSPCWFIHTHIHIFIVDAD